MLLEPMHAVSITRWEKQAKSSAWDFSDLQDIGTHLWVSWCVSHWAADVMQYVLLGSGKRYREFTTGQ